MLLPVLLVAQCSLAGLMLLARETERRFVRSFVVDGCGDVVDPDGEVSRSLRTFDDGVPVETFRAERRDGRTAVVHRLPDFNLRTFVYQAEFYDLDCEGPATARPDDECTPTPDTSCPRLREDGR